MSEYKGPYRVENWVLNYDGGDLDQLVIVGEKSPEDNNEVSDEHFIAARLNRADELEAKLENSDGTQEFLVKENNNLRQAGFQLAKAALRVVEEYDGIHRLSLAISKWFEAIANSGGRGKQMEE